MQDVHYRLSILTKAVQHKNLSAAADHIGLSQPQLSRVISKLEDDFQIVLLDRGVRRKSSWTEAAIKLSEVYLQNEMTLQSSIRKILGQQLFSTVRIGTLEGLSHLALHYAHSLFNSLDVKEIHLDIFEIGELESHFEAGELDLIFTFKIPGRQKYKNTLEVGYQNINAINTDGPYLVCSPYEYSQYKLKAKKLNKKVFLSNSLFLRKKWLKQFKGIGYIPTKISLNPKSNTDYFPLFLIGSDLLSPQVWSKVENVQSTEEDLNGE